MTLPANRASHRSTMFGMTPSKVEGSLKDDIMRRWHLAVTLVVSVGLISGVALTAQTQKVGAPAESKDMQLVGYNDLQARSAYEPTIKKQGDRYIAYIGHHGGEQMNALTGKMEKN